MQTRDVTAEQAQRLFGNVLEREYSMTSLMRRPETSYQSFAELERFGPYIDDQEVVEQLNIQAKYAGYMQRQSDEIAKAKRLQETVIPECFDYSLVKGLSNEVLQKLTSIRPTTVSQASRISGMTPAAVSLLLVHLKGRAGDSQENHSQENKTREKKSQSQNPSSRKQA